MGEFLGVMKRGIRDMTEMEKRVRGGETTIR